MVPSAELGGDCQEQPFAATTPVPEASGAAWLTIDGKLGLVVIADSGNAGAYGIVDPETGATVETGSLPLAGREQDLEGLATWNGHLVAITSAGWIGEWTRGSRGFERVGTPYPIAPVGPMACNAATVNCGKNYEGICLTQLATPSSDACTGFVAAKSDGRLYCLVARGDRLVVDEQRSIEVARPGAVADCAFSESGSLYVGSNLFDLGTVYAISGWQDPATAKVRAIGALGTGFPETLAVRGDVVYRMSDLGTRGPSAMKKYRCR